MAVQVRYTPRNHASRSEGLKIKLSPLPGGLTVGLDKRPLLKPAFVFQCPPMNEFPILRANNPGLYDTIYDGQFARRGSRQLPTWTFDTLAMYLGSDEKGYAPAWVPFPTPTNNRVKHPPEWYRDQLGKLNDAGSPFRLVANFKNGPTVLRSYAILTGFTESHKAGEGDAIYFEQVSFTQWRDPTITEDGMKTPRGAKSLPTHVYLRSDNPPSGDLIVGSGVGAYTTGGQRLPSSGAVTMSILARFFYGDPTLWRSIARANGISEGPHTALTDAAKYRHLRKFPGTVVKIPAPDAYVKAGSGLAN